MSIESRSNQYGPVFEHWQIKELLGQGSGGKTAVFLLSRNDSFKEFCALKVINLIEERGRLDDFPEHRKKEYQAALDDCKAQATPEVQMMLDLRGNTNVVDYLDHKFVSWSDASGFGCDLLIRMELLTDLRSIIRTGRIFDESEILHLGRDICTALVLCHDNDILHRDIKPENIMVNKKGNYKLGDFGVSRLLGGSASSMATTGIGTPEYAAPEQFSGKHDKRVDIYSLGLVLYELCNQNRLPFSSSSYVRQADIQKRQSGAPFPRPDGISSGLWSVIQKACAFKPSDRFATAQQFLTALCALDGTPVVPHRPAPVKRNTNQTVKATPVPGYETQPATSAAQGQRTYETVPAESYPSHKAGEARKRSFPVKLVAILVVLALLAGGGFVLYSKIANEAAQKEAIDGIISNAQQLASQSDYEGAVNEIENGLLDYPDSSELKEQLDIHQSSLAEQKNSAAIDDAAALADKKDYVGAMSIINSVRNTYGTNDDLDAVYNSYLKADSLAKAEQYASSGDNLQALSTVNTALDIIGADSELQAAASQYQTAYVDEVLAAAETYLSTGDISGAEKAVAAGLKNVPNDSRLSEKAAEIKTYKPTSMATAQLIDSNNWSVNEGEAIDNFGNTHYSSYTSVIVNYNSMFGENGYFAEYRVYGKYKTLTGTVSNYQMIEGATLKIFADDVLLRTFTVDKKTDPISFALDITGADYIKFEVDLKWRSGVILSDVFMSNMPTDESVSSDIPTPPAGSDPTGSPVTLAKQTLVDSNGWSLNEIEPVDVFGISHYSSCTGVFLNTNGMFGENGYFAEYRVYKRFKTFTGTISPYTNIEGATVRIFLDDVLVQTYEIDNKTDPIEFSFDVTDVDYIKIEADLLWSTGVIVSDLEVT